MVLPQGIEYHMGCVRYLRKRGAHARARVTVFLKENGFEHDVNSKKKGRFGLALRCFRLGQEKLESWQESCVF